MKTKQRYLVIRIIRFRKIYKYRIKLKIKNQFKKSETSLYKYWKLSYKKMNYQLACSRLLIGSPELVLSYAKKNRAYEEILWSAAKSTFSWVLLRILLCEWRRNRCIVNLNFWVIDFKRSQGHQSLTKF